MPIYVDLQPDPQFDESLVRYCVINFRRFRDALTISRKRIHQETYSQVGPWPQSILVNVPFYCDVVIWGSLGFWATVPSVLIGYAMTWDNANLPVPWDMYFNEGGSGKTLEAANVVRGVTKGQHGCSQRGLTGALGSDTNSRLRLEFTFYEI
jgi:hypothetical protein